MKIISTLIEDFFNSIVFLFECLLEGASVIAPFVIVAGGIALFIYVGVFGAYKLGAFVSKKYLK